MAAARRGVQCAQALEGSSLHDAARKGIMTWGDGGGGWRDGGVEGVAGSRALLDSAGHCGRHILAVVEARG
jgi:hypothetical protein